LAPNQQAYPKETVAAPVLFLPFAVPF